MLRLFPVMTVLALSGSVFLAGCSGSDDEADPQADAIASVTALPIEKQVEVVDSGFGQQGDNVSVVAVVENLTDVVGQSVQVQFVLKNAAGDQLASVGRGVSFTAGEEKAAVAGFATLKGVANSKVASVEVTLQKGTDPTATADPSAPKLLGTASGKATKLKNGTWTASFRYVNKGEDASGLGGSAVCFSGKKIVGGGQVQGGAVKSGKATKLAVANFYLSGKPDSCTAYVVASA